MLSHCGRSGRARAWSGAAAVLGLVGAMTGLGARAARADTISVVGYYGSGIAGGASTAALSAYPYLVSGGGYNYLPDVTQAGKASDWMLFSASETANHANYLAGNAIWDASPAGGTESFKTPVLVNTVPTGNFNGTRTLSTSSDAGTLGTTMAIQYSGATPGAASGIDSVNVYANPEGATAGVGMSFTQTLATPSESLTLYLVNYVGTLSNVAGSYLNVSTSGGGTMAPLGIAGTDLAQGASTVVGNAIVVLDISGSVGDQLTVSWAYPANSSGDYANVGMWGASAGPLVVVPEPASLGMLVGLGLVGLYLRPRRGGKVGPANAS